MKVCIDEGLVIDTNDIIRMESAESRYDENSKYFITIENKLKQTYGRYKLKLPYEKEYMVTKKQFLMIRDIMKDEGRIK